MATVIITGPNENSQKASISVYVLAANSQDEVYEGTTRPRPESDKQTRKLDDEMNNNDPDWVSTRRAGKLYKASSRLYRSQNLKENMR